MIKLANNLTKESSIKTANNLINFIKTSTTAGDHHND